MPTQNIDTGRDRQGPLPDWMKPHPHRPRPTRIRVFFCSVCGFSTGIEDYDRIRHEHFENDRRCKNGVWDIRTYVLEDQG